MSAFRVLLVPGVNPDRWLRVWRERLADVPLEVVVVAADEAVARLRAGEGDVALVRLPVDRDGLSVIPLYEERTVVLVAKDHVFTAVDEVSASDLADEVVVVPGDDVLVWDCPGERFAGDVATTPEAVDLVAAGHAVLVLPHSLGRIHQRRGVASRPVVDAPGSGVGLAWVTDRHDELTEEFIGIVRGRTAASSRGRGGAEPSGGSSSASSRTRGGDKPRATGEKPRAAGGSQRRSTGKGSSTPKPRRTPPKGRGRR
ncbi:LysR substrate-binding domain-containing protein [Cellulomonas sp. HZM]|uniref:LysR substrate-binding domain-containing protein n=1 Tax=Cellulomonas sp. HZM TaxID=1454010 RepID=UPI0005523CC0|nr:LysR substrate-binding domain-containing protein [Cellulomonas sp. HZM]